MWKHLFILVCVAFAACGSAFGQTASSSAVQSSEQLQVMQGQGFGQASSVAEGGQAVSSAQGGAGGQGGQAGAYLQHDPTYNYNYPEPKTPLPGMGFAPLPIYPPTPEQIALWNRINSDIRYRVRVWTREEVNHGLSEHGLNLWREYRTSGRRAGFKWKAVTINKSSPVNQIEVRLSSTMIRNPDGQVVTIGHSYEEINQKFKFFGDVAVMGSKGKMQSLAFLLSLRIAMDHGVDMALLSLGMNTVLVGSNFSPGVGGGHSVTNYSLLGIGGFSSSKMGGEGEPISTLTLFRRNGNHIPSKIPQPEEKAPVPDDSIKEVPPEILGVHTSSEARARANISEVVKMSPSL